MKLRQKFYTTSSMTGEILSFTIVFRCGRRICERKYHRTCGSVGCKEEGWTFGRKEEYSAYRTGHTD